MKVEFLGTGGAFPTPRPGCDCAICVQARERGVPYARTGPCLFVHGPNLLIDTPEECRQQLNRSGVGRSTAARTPIGTPITSSVDASGNR